MQHLTLMYEADLALYKNSGKPYWQMYPKLNALKLHPPPTKKTDPAGCTHIDDFCNPLVTHSHQQLMCSFTLKT